jgi:hypothetical protein
MQFTKYFVEPAINGDVVLGAASPQDKLFVGKLSERGNGPPRKVFMDISKEFVSIVIGQRGSGKSFCLGSMLEAIATRNVESSISKRISPRAALLLDPTGNFWTTALPLSANGSDRVRRQHALLEGWDISVEDINCDVWLPAGYKTATDNPLIKEFHFDTGDFDEQDWADILGINLVSEPQGMLLGDVFFKTTVDGWNGSGGRVRPKARATLHDLIECLSSCVEFRDRASGYQDGTIQVLHRNLSSYARRPLFSAGATKLTDLLKPNQLSILMMPYRVDRNLRSVMSRVLIKKILRDREVASQIQNRLDFEVLPGAEREVLEAELSRHVPRSIVALDEAQELLGDRGGRERESLEDFCLIGRNFGLSMIIATQRPETNALSGKVRDQAGTWFIHQLASQANIKVVAENLVAAFPAKVNDGRGNLDITSLLRQLEPGQALVASKRISNSQGIQRAFIMDVRP